MVAHIDQPKIEKNITEQIKLAVQINGKTRDIINIAMNMNEDDVYQIVSKSSKAKKYIYDKKISKTIFVKNRIINFIIKD